MGEQRAHRLRGFGAIYTQFLPGCTGGRCKNSSVRLFVCAPRDPFAEHAKGARYRDSVPRPFRLGYSKRAIELGSLLVLEVTHLRQVFGAGCGVQACFVCTLRQLGKLAVAALVVDHADEDCCEEENQ